MKYDYLVVGSGLFGAVFAREAFNAGKKVLVVEKRNHIGGNIYTERVDGIDIHKYGAHIFHTDNRRIWDYINQFGEFNDYRHRVIANYRDSYYDLPFNMNTFHQIWGVTTAEEAREIIRKQGRQIIKPSNLEEKCISLVGNDVYKILVKGYTEKQWGRKCVDLPASIIDRIPVRFEYNNDYFIDRYQGVPINGYTAIIEKMLEGIEVVLNYDYLEHKNEIDYEKLVYTGPIDAYYDYIFGPLQYRTVVFETNILDVPYYQTNAVVNYTDDETPYTRIIEHKYFLNEKNTKTIISKEFPKEWRRGMEPFYPIRNDLNMLLYQKYYELSKNDEDVVFGGRLGEYRYYDMDETVKKALACWKRFGG